MEIRFEKEQAHNYFIPDCKGVFCEENYQLHMLTENRIQGLIPVSIRHRNGLVEYYYDITTRKSVKQIYDNEFLRAEDIQTILKAIYSTIQEIRKYLLDENSLSLDPELIYINTENDKPEFTYLPELHGNIAESFALLAQYILHRLDQKDSRTVELGYELFRQSSEKDYNLEKVLEHAFMNNHEVPAIRKAEAEEEEELRITSGETVDLKEKEDDVPLKKVEKKSENKTMKIPSQKRKKSGNGEMILICGIVLLLFFLILFLIYRKILTVTQGGGITFLMVGIFGYFLSEIRKGKPEGKKKDPYVTEVRLEQERVHREQKKKSKKAEEHMEMENPGATTVLWQGEEEYEARLSLISLDTRKRQSILLVNDSYLIGKLKSKVDILIEDETVSRVHAKLEKKNGVYYLQDMNSTNGTYVNGRRLEGEEKAALELTDEIRFAESGFYVGKC